MDAAYASMDASVQQCIACLTALHSVKKRCKVNSSSASIPLMSNLKSPTRIAGMGSFHSSHSVHKRCIQIFAVMVKGVNQPVGSNKFATSDSNCLLVIGGSIFDKLQVKRKHLMKLPRNTWGLIYELSLKLFPARMPGGNRFTSFGSIEIHFRISELSNVILIQRFELS